MERWTKCLPAEIKNKVVITSGEFSSWSNLSNGRLNLRAMNELQQMEEISSLGVFVGFDLFLILIKSPSSNSNRYVY